MQQYSMVFTSIVFFSVLCAGYWFFVMKGASGLLPRKKTPQRKPTMFDVRRMLQEGNRDQAIRIYIQIFKVSQKKARKDIEELERNLKV